MIKMSIDEALSFGKTYHGTITRMSFSSGWTLLPENRTTSRCAYLQKCHPQTLIDICRYRQRYQNLIPSSGSSESFQLFGVSLEIKKDNTKNVDLLNKPDESVGDMDSKDRKEFSSDEILHGRISILLDELKSLNDEIDCTQASRNALSGPTSNEVSSAEFQCMKNVTRTMFGQRRNMIRHGHSGNRYIVKLQVEALSEKSSWATRYKNSIECSVDKLLNLMTQGYFVYLIYLETKMIMMELIIMDCKLHVKVFVEHIKQRVNSICEGILDVSEKKSLQTADEHMIEACTQQGEETDKVADEVEAQERDKLNVIDEKEKANLSQTLGWFSWVLVVICMSVLLSGANANHLNKRITTKLLTSKTCSHYKFYSLESKCLTNEIAHNLTIFQFCQFDKLCSSDEHPVCVNTDRMGVYVCLKKWLSCSKGRMIIARQDDTFIDIVHLEEVDCPIGTFQPTDSDCIQACSFKHTDMAYLGDKYVVSSAGDNVNPTFVYCNYKKGYYNPEGKLTLNYDRDLIWNPEFCVNENKCMNGQFHLPDGRCVSACKHGFERSPPNFHCQQMDSSNSPSTLAPMSSTTQLSTSKTVPSTTNVFLGSHTTTQKITTDGRDKTNVYGGETNGTFPWWGYVLCVVGVLVGVCVGFAMYYIYSNRARTHNAREKERTEKNRIIKIKRAKYVYIDNNVEQGDQGGMV